MCPSCFVLFQVVEDSSLSPWSTEGVCSLDFDLRSGVLSFKHKKLQKQLQIENYSQDAPYRVVFLDNAEGSYKLLHCHEIYEGR